MTTNAAIEIKQALSELNQVRRNSFRRELIKIAGRQLTRDTVSADGWSAGVAALERFVVDSVAEAVPKLLAISKSTAAFALLERASIAELQELAEMLREWRQQRVAPLIIPSNATWMPAIRNTLERQLDTYRISFKDAPAGEPEEKAIVGRKPKDWLTASNFVWGQLYRGELDPDTQATIERALVAYFEGYGLTVAESTVRPYANRIFSQLKSKA